MAVTNIDHDQTKQKMNHINITDNPIGILDNKISCKPNAIQSGKTFHKFKSLQTSVEDTVNGVRNK